LPGIRLALTPLSEAGSRMIAFVTEELSPSPVDIVEDRERQRGRGYYRDVCFTVSARVNDELEESGDGGFTDWSTRPTASSKERLLISGLGIERLALFLESG
jgi:hypothetical protein